jgi:hypothetical protein
LCSYLGPAAVGHWAVRARRAAGHRHLTAGAHRAAPYTCELPVQQTCRTTLLDRPVHELTKGVTESAALHHGRSAQHDRQRANGAAEAASQQHRSREVHCTAKSR